MREISCVFLDVVGTILQPHSPVNETYYHFGNKHGSSKSTDFIKSAFESAFVLEELKDAKNAYKTDEFRESERWRNIVAACFPDLKNPDLCFKDLFEHYAKPNSWSIPLGVSTLLDHLDCNLIPWGIASNFDFRLKDIIEKKAEFNRCKWQVISSVVGYKKPSHLFFQHLLTASGFPANKILMVGDNFENDITPAEQLGMRAFQVKERLGSINSFEGLIQLLGK